MPHEFLDIFARCREYTRTTIERMYAMYCATNHLVDVDAAGAFVECGVWRGGSIMVALLTLLQRGRADRDVYLYDTFDGMTDPTDDDVDYQGHHASAMLEHFGVQTYREICNVSLDDVRVAITHTGYPVDRVHFVEGDVEHTIPSVVPPTIALLRLDTDFYASTKHELVHLYPRLVPGGILIVDDFGHFAGARKAVLEYMQEHDLSWFLNRIDCTGRLVVK
jgi:hypothetical protein